MQRFALGLLAALILGGMAAVLWFKPASIHSDSSTTPPPAASAPSQSPAETAAPREVRPPEAQAPEAPVVEADTVEVTEAPASARRSIEELGLAIEGFVNLPANLPGDELLEVVVLRSEPSPWQERALLGDSTEDLIDDELALGATEVDARGRFLARVPADTAEVWLLLRGRYIYVSEAVHALPGAEQPVELPAKLGAWVTGNVRPPKSATASELEGLGENIRLDPDLTRAMGMGALDYEGPRRREASADELDQHRFEFRGVRPSQGYKLRVGPKHLAAFSSTPFEVTAGQHVVLDLPVTRGAVLAGVVVDGNGVGIAGAEIEIEQDPMVFGAGGFEVREGKSEADGSFVLGAVAAGHLSMRVKRDGYLDSSQEFDLGEGEFREGLEIVLDSGNSITGRVIWPDGRPAVDVEVNVGFDASFLGGMEAFNAMRGADGEARTDAEGRFVVTGLGKGPFTVRCESKVEGQEDGEDPSRAAAEAADLEDFDPFAESVDSSSLGQNAPWRARADGVRPTSDPLELILERPLGVVGRVVDDLGEPVAKFKVHARTVTGGMLSGLGAESHSDSFTDEAGVFFLGGLRACEWELFAAAEGYGLAEPLLVELPMDEDATVTLTLERTASVSGTVVASNGRAMAGAKVSQPQTLKDFGRMASGDFTRPSTTTDAAGRFTLEGLTPGTVLLVAKAEGHAPSESVSTEVAPAGVATDIVLTLRVGGRILGKIFDKEGEVMPGQSIMCQNPIDPSSQLWANSDDDGEFTFADLAPGQYQVMTLPTGGGGTGDDGAGDFAAMMEQMKFTMATVVEGEDTEVALGAKPEAAVKVTGRVLIGDEPVAGAMLTFFADGGGGFESMKLMSTDKDGRFKTELNKPGGYMINVQQVNGTGQQQSVEFFEVIPEVETHALEIDLPVGGISGRVTGSDGEPAVNARVTLGIEGPIPNGSFTGGNYSEVWTDAKGEYSLKWLRPGDYTVAAGGSFLGGMFGDIGGEVLGRQVRRDLNISEGQWLSGIDFELNEAGRLTGNVVDASGQPVRDAAIFLRDAAGNSIDRITMVQSDAAGKFVYGGLDPGNYRVTARTSGQVTSEPVSASIAAGNDTQVTVSVAAGTMVVVTLTDKQGEDVRCNVEVTGPDGRQVNGLWSMSDLMTALTGGGISSRETRVGPLAPGTYQLVATSADGLSAKKSLTLDGQEERRVRLRLK
ncbi:carboxypeptidase regulatory-like domain-containing protein [Engelhardtia mirabilis]|uniref:Nickel uptake substrate-specific transmembrane region n=1 Tax=Engelhardtia mirabilis TaxID=2528011 RepID=A0A518BGL5_9BACT|nr:Nickel uptake substrate-specific transmembrane region [Planctomycetes bacterium Pla133]QDV00390.1 Nickel uptake substrate-specific transmembrane region [Planctomycetes bacterium Pla86]